MRSVRSRSIRLGVLGGTFDPIHYGHLLMAHEAVRTLALDTVLFVPTGLPSHKDSTGISPASERCGMVEGALMSKPNFKLSFIDVERSSPTYTIDTVRDLRAEHGDAVELHVLVGADNLGHILEWRRSAELLRLAHIVGFSRLGYGLVNPGVPSGKLMLLHVPRHGISATKIRELVSEGRSASHLIPPAVARYIDERGLYRSETAARRPGARRP
jgi:nicotinate-nucleotide adenylyltransferase